jgi:hypothetical protein
LFKNIKVVQEYPTSEKLEISVVQEYQFILLNILIYNKCPVVGGLRDIVGLWIDAVRTPDSLIIPHETP